MAKCRFKCVLDLRKDFSSCSVVYWTVGVMHKDKIPECKIRIIRKGIALLLA